MVTDADIPIEVRVFSLDAALEGQIEIGKVKITPLKTRRLRVRI